MNMCSVGYFLGVASIGLAVGYNLVSGVGFVGELASWILCRAFLPVSTFGYPPV